MINKLVGTKNTPPHSEEYNEFKEYLGKLADAKVPVLDFSPRDKPDSPAPTHRDRESDAATIKAAGPDAHIVDLDLDLDAENPTPETKLVASSQESRRNVPMVISASMKGWSTVRDAPYNIRKMQDVEQRSVYYATLDMDQKLHIIRSKIKSLNERAEMHLKKHIMIRHINRILNTTHAICQCATLSSVVVDLQLDEHIATVVASVFSAVGLLTLTLKNIIAFNMLEQRHRNSYNSLNSLVGAVEARLLKNALRSEDIDNMVHEINLAESIMATYETAVYRSS
jgi:hypothetical protein